MSSTTTPSASDGGASVASPPSNHNYLANIGLGYIIAITLGFLVLLSTVLLASYVCCRTGGRQRHRHNRSHNARSSSDGIAVPRVFFVAESEEGGGDNDDQEAAAVGLDAAVINSYPKFSFSRSSDLGTSNNLCSICLCEYKDSEMLRMMPDCRHFFHLFCLDAWLRLNGSCPVCRNSPLPTPLSTPLSEVVPLSQYQR